MNVLHQDEVKLAGLIKNGNQLAFATIFDRYNKQLYILAYRYLKSREMAEDAVQQIFVNFWVNRDKINENLNIKSLLFTSLKNHAINELRNNRRAIEKNYEILMESVEEVDEMNETEEHSQMAILIEKAAEKLSPQRRQIYHLKIIKGCSNQEIADNLGISINTVKVQYYHILKEIKFHLGNSMISSLVLISLLYRY